MKRKTLWCHCNTVPANKPIRKVIAEARCAVLSTAARFGIVNFIEHDGTRVPTLLESVREMLGRPAVVGS